MAVNRNKKQTEEAEEVKAQDLTIKVTRAKDFTQDGADGCCIAFDMEVNGVTIYGNYYREGKKKDGSDYAMVSFPSRKDDKGKYWNHAYVKLTDAQIEDISKQIENLI